MDQVEFRQLLRSERFSEALEEIEGGNVESLTEVDLELGRALCLAALGRADEAVRVAAKIGRDEGGSDQRAALGLVAKLFLDQGAYQGALLIGLECLRLFPGNAVLELTLVPAALKTGKVDLARTLARAARKHAPDDNRTWAWEAAVETVAGRRWHARWLRREARRRGLADQSSAGSVA